MKLAFAGKGGVGKTTLTAWLGDYLARQGHDVWLVDADTALSLGVACGLAPDQLPEALTRSEELIRERIGSGMMCLNPDLTDLPARLAVSVPVCGPVSPGVTPGVKRLLLMGRVEEGGGGCACGANALLKAFLAHMFFAEQGYVLVDLEAGVEHLGRGTASVADGLVVVSEPSLRSLLTAAEVSRLARQIGLDRQVLVINRSTGPMRKDGLTPALPLPTGPADRATLDDLPPARLAVPVLDALRQREWDNGSVLFQADGTQENQAALSEADALCARLLALFQAQREN